MVPSYNCAPYLATTLRSVVAQRPRHVAEIEVIDDQSSDDTPDVVATFADRGVRYYRHAERQGAIGNFNSCLRRATGDLVHLLHADDEVLNGFYERMAAPFADPEVIAVVCRTQYIDEHGRQLHTTRAERDEPGVWADAYETLSVSNRVRPAAIVVRRSVYEEIGGFRTDLPHAADWEMWVRIAKHGHVWFENDVLARHRLHSESDTSGRIRNAANIVERAATIDLISTAHPTRRTPRLRRKAMGYSALFAGRTAVRLARKRDWEGARSQAMAALRCAVGGAFPDNVQPLSPELPADSWIGPPANGNGNGADDSGRNGVAPVDRNGVRDVNAIQHLHHRH